MGGGGGVGDARLILHIGSSGTMLDFTRYQARIFIYIHFFDDAIEGCDCYIEEVGLTADRLHS